MDATTYDPFNGPRQVNWNLWDPSSDDFTVQAGPGECLYPRRIRGHGLAPDGRGCVPAFRPKPKKNPMRLPPLTIGHDLRIHDQHAALHFRKWFADSTAWPMIAVGEHLTIQFVAEEAGAQIVLPGCLLPGYAIVGQFAQCGRHHVGHHWASLQSIIFDSSWVTGHDIACAPHLPRVARGWIRPAANLSRTGEFCERRCVLSDV